jgi:DGQHR domain-containing protein
VIQKGSSKNNEIYITTLKALDVTERCIIDRWTSANNRGYQRLPTLSRLNDAQGGILRYLLKDLACFPTSILVNIREDISFEKLSKNDHYELGKLDIGDNKLWLIDGQHRVEALKRACMHNVLFESYPILVSILVRPERFDELLLFYVVNRKQKNVPTDLAYRHLQRMLWEKGSKWLYEFEGARGVRLGLASEIIDDLNLNYNSPWFHRIRMVGDEDEGQLVDDRFFITVLAKILKNNVFTGMPVGDFSQSLLDYWSCIKDIYPQAFNNPHEYTLLSRAGIYVFSTLFPMFAIELKKTKINQKENFLKSLNGLKKTTPDHSSPDFIKPIGIDCWSKKSASAIFLGRTRKDLDELLSGIQEKIILSRSIEEKQVQQNLIVS